MYIKEINYMYVPNEIFSNIPQKAKSNQFIRIYLDIKRTIMCMFENISFGTYIVYTEDCFKRSVFAQPLLCILYISDAVNVIHNLPFVCNF